MIPEIGVDFYVYALPILALLVGALMLMLFAVSPLLSNMRVIFITSLAFIIAALLSSFLLPAQNYQALGGAYLVDGIARFGHIFILLIAISICFLLRESHLADRFFRGDILCIFLLTLAGMLVMLSSYDLLTIFVGLETFSLGTYALIGYIKQTRFSQEAAIKYFILGSFAAAILLFGFAFLYAATGTLHLQTIMLLDNHNSLLLQVSGIFIAAGLAFKLALVPCHLWTPDAYEGAPTAITAFMAIAVKATMILLALRFFSTEILSSLLTPVLLIFASLSMLVGNLMALAQRSMKRMLAYSSIAHGGYLAMALLAINNDSELIGAVLYYLIAYGVVSLGTFAIIIWFENDERENISIDDLRGLGKKHPFACFALSVFVLALAGIPPTVGFFAKFTIFQVAMLSEMYLLLVIGLVGSAISFYYYLRVIVYMYFVEGKTTITDVSFSESKLTFALISFSLIFALSFGMFFAREQLQSLVFSSHVSYLN